MVIRLGDACTKIGSGATPKGGKAAYLDSGPFALVRSQNVHNHGFEHGGLAFISEEQASKLDGVTVFPRDVLLNITGDSVARVCQAPEDLGPARVNQHVAIIRPTPEVLDPQFLRYYLVNVPVQEHMLALASVGATRPALTKSMIEGFEIEAPEIEEQREIASILGALDDKIELNRRMSATLEDMARSLYRSWFIDFDPVHAKMEGCQPAFMDEATAALFPDRFGEDGLPEGWEMNEIDSLCTIKGGKQLTKDRFADDGAFPVFGGAGQMGMANEFNADGYVITVGRVGAYCGNFVAHRGKAWVNNNASLIEPLQQIPAEFLFLALTALDLSSIKKGAAQPFISNGDLKKLTTTIPDAPVLDAFNEKAKVFQLRTEVLQSENQTLAALRDSLLPKLMSGELRVVEAREQVEEDA